MNNHTKNCLNSQEISGIFCGNIKNGKQPIKVDFIPAIPASLRYVVTSRAGSENHYWLMTLEILKTGINKAMAMVPMITPMSVIISGSMREVATRMEFCSFLPR